MERYNKLRELRLANKYTVQNMADMIGISKSFYSQLENCKRRLLYDMAIRIAAVFKMKPDELFYKDHLNLKKEKKK